MLPLTVLLSLVAVTSAGNYSLPKEFDVNKVELGTRSAWCTAERSSCPKICGGVADENLCDPQNLSFSCKCNNGTDADVEPFSQTVPYFVCQANFGQCIDAHPDDADAQQKCKNENKCGSRNATEELGSSKSSSSSSSSSTPSSTVPAGTRPSSVDAASTDESSSPSTTANAAGAIRAMAQEHSTGVLATALFVAMRLVL